MDPFSVYRDLDRGQRWALRLGAALVALGVAGTRVASEPAWIRFWDNVHWTAGYGACAAMVWRGYRAAPAELRRIRGLLAFATIGYLVGQVLWDIQVAVGWNPFPGPSDIFFSMLGPGLGAAFASHLRTLPPEARRAAYLDVFGIAVASFAFTLALYLPHTHGLALAPLATMVSYPVALTTALGALLASLLHLRFRLTPSVLITIGAVLADAALWMEWNRRTLENTLADGVLLNYGFSVASLALGAGLARWAPVPDGGEAAARAYFAASNALPVLLAVGAGLTLALSPTLTPIVAPWVAACSVVIVLVSVARQSLALVDRDRRLYAESRARQMEERYRQVLEARADTQRLQALGTLAGGIAHDFNNILMAIRIHVEAAFVSPGSPPGPEVHDAVLRLTDRGRHLVRRILVFAQRGEKGDPQALDLRDSVREAMDLLRPLLPAQIELTSRLP
jgi:signal transduction histidine kinase